MGALTFTGPLPAAISALALVLVAVVLLERRVGGSARRRLARILVRGLVLALVAFAVMDPRTSYGISAGRDLVVVVDAGSVRTPEGRKAAEVLLARAREAAAEQGAALAVFVSGAVPRRVRPDAPDALVAKAGDEAAAGRLARGIEAARLSIASDRAGAIVVLSDGRDPIRLRDPISLGSDPKLIGIVVPPPAPPRPPPDALIEALSAPTVAAQGPFPVRARVTAPPGAVVRLSLDGRRVASKEAGPAAGWSETTFDVTAAPPGLHEVALSVEDRTGRPLALERTLVRVEAEPRVVFVDGHETGVLAPFSRFARDQGLLVSTAPPFPGRGECDVFVLDADAAAALPPSVARGIADLVKEGAGLLLLAGTEGTLWGRIADGPLAEVLPVRPRVPPPPPPPPPDPTPPKAPTPPPPPKEPPPPGPGLSAERRPEKALPISLLLVIDRSGSMTEERKLDMGILAAEQAAAALTRWDRVGVVTFADEPTLDTPFRPAGQSATALVGPLEPGGNTDVFAALMKAEEVMAAETSPIRHVLLLTDGRQTGVAFFGDLVDRFQKAGITLTAVGLGYQSDDFLLKRITRYEGGHYFFAATPRDLPRILTRDTQRVADERLARAEKAPRVDDPSARPPDVPPRPAEPSAPVPPRPGPEASPPAVPPSPPPLPPPTAVPLVRVRPHEALLGVDVEALPRVGVPYPADPAPGSAVLLARADGAPVLVAGRPGLGRSLVWALPRVDPGAAGWRDRSRLFVQAIRSLLPSTEADPAPALHVESRPDEDVLRVSLPDSTRYAEAAESLSVVRHASDGAKPARFLGVEDGEALFALPAAPGEVEAVRAEVLGGASITFLARRAAPPAGSDPAAFSTALGKPLHSADDPSLFVVPDRTQTERNSLAFLFALFAALLLPLDVFLHRRSSGDSRAKNSTRFVAGPT